MFQLSLSEPSRLCELMKLSLCFWKYQELLFPQVKLDITTSSFSHECETHLLFLWKRICGTITFTCEI